MVFNLAPSVTGSCYTGYKFLKYPAQILILEEYKEAC
jgi:hypothetical protein